MRLAAWLSVVLNVVIIINGWVIIYQGAHDGNLSELGKLPERIIGPAWKAGWR